MCKQVCDMSSNYLLTNFKATFSDDEHQRCYWIKKHGKKKWNIKNYETHENSLLTSPLSRLLSHLLEPALDHGVDFPRKFT